MPRSSSTCPWPRSTSAWTRTPEGGDGVPAVGAHGRGRAVGGCLEVYWPVSTDARAQTEAPFFHVGIVVADLDAAIGAFERAFGVTFNEPSVLAVEVEDGDGRRQAEVRV